MAPHPHADRLLVQVPEWLLKFEVPGRFIGPMNATYRQVGDIFARHLRGKMACLEIVRVHLDDSGTNTMNLLHVLAQPYAGIDDAEVGDALAEIQLYYTNASTARKVSIPRGRRNLIPLSRVREYVRIEVRGIES